MVLRSDLNNFHIKTNNKGAPKKGIQRLRLIFELTLLRDKEKKGKWNIWRSDQIRPWNNKVNQSGAKEVEKSRFEERRSEIRNFRRGLSKKENCQEY